MTGGNALWAFQVEWLPRQMSGRAFRDAYGRVTPSSSLWFEREKDSVTFSSEGYRLIPNPTLKVQISLSSRTP